MCAHCQTSLFLEDEAVAGVGERSALAEVPSILELGRRFEYRLWDFETYGRIRFDYGDGFWDEWWVVLSGGDGRWISVDEGDIAVESPLEVTQAAPAFEALAVGDEVDFAGQTLSVTEKNRARCVGVEGELPEVITHGEEHDYLHLSGPGGVLLTLEYHDARCDVFKGVWIDPFELKPR